MTQPNEIDETAFQAFMLAMHDHGTSGLGYRNALQTYEAAKPCHSGVDYVIHMPEELRGSFEDYYEGVADVIDRRGAQWGFECGALHGSCTQEHPDSKLVGAVKSVLAKLETGTNVQSPIMQAWDSARTLIAEGDDSDLPRMIFENIVDDVVAVLEEALRHHPLDKE